MNSAACRREYDCVTMSRLCAAAGRSASRSDEVHGGFPRLPHRGAGRTLAPAASCGTDRPFRDPHPARRRPHRTPPCRTPCRPGVANRRNCCRCCATPRSRSASCRPRRSSASPPSSHVPIARVRGVMAFYSFLYPESPGTYRVLFSDNVTDRMRGSTDRLREMSQRLWVEPGKVSEDGLVSLDRTSSHRPVRPRAGGAGERPPGTGRGRRARRAALRPDPRARAARRVAARAVRRRGHGATRRRHAQRSAATGRRDPRGARPRRGERHRAAGHARRDQGRAAARPRRRRLHDRREVGELQPPAGDAARRRLQCRRGRARHVQGPPAARPPRRHGVRGHDGRGLRHRRDARASSTCAANTATCSTRCATTLERRRRDGLLGHGDLRPGGLRFRRRRSTSARARTSAARPRRWSSRSRASAASRATGRRGSRRRAISAARRSSTTSRATAPRR